MARNDDHDHQLNTGKVNTSGNDEGWVPEAELSPEALAEVWARRAHALAEPSPAEVTGQAMPVLTFLLQDERYGLPVSHVREVYPLGQITPVPRTPNFVVGVFSARGRLISVIDLRAFLGLSPTECSAESKIIVVTAADLEVGFLADTVTDVLTIFQDELEPARPPQVGSRAEFMLGIAPDMLVVLNIPPLFNDERLIVHEEVL